MINPYPKPRWDLENDVLRLEQMINVYEQEIKSLQVEKKELQEEVLVLKKELKYYKSITGEEKK